MTHWCPALGLPLGLNIMEAIITAGRRSRIWTVATVQETLEDSAVIYCRCERYHHLRR